jgi:NADPH-dependent glutamate synthase beta subunit-like oxidoreductase
MGVEARTNQVMGRDFTVESLMKEGYDAVILTAGGYDSLKLLQPDHERFEAGVDGLFVMLDVFSAINRGKPLALGKHAVIVDSSLNGLELALRCRDKGAEKVTIVSHQPLDALPLKLRETKQRAAQGIDVWAATTVSGLRGAANRLTHVDLERTGPRGEVAWRTETLDADTLILATGRLPELVFLRIEAGEESEAQDVSWQTIEAFHAFPVGRGKGIFSPPEPGRMSDSAAVVKTILSGRRVARAVQQYFTDESISPIEHLTCEADYVLDVTGVRSVQASVRQRPAVVDVAGDSKIAWIFPKEFPGLDEAAAKKEAERCLQCGLICYRKTAYGI